MKIALTVESPHASPQSRALAVARRLAGAEPLLGVACLVDPTADPRALAAGLGLTAAAFVVDAALAKAGSRGRAQALACLLQRLDIDLAVVDAGADGGAGLFSAALAHFRGARGLFRADDITEDAGHPESIVVELGLAGQRRKLRVTLPAVVSLFGEATAVPPLATTDVHVETFTLADLGLSAASLVSEPVPGAVVVPAQRKAQTVTDIAALID